MSRLRKRIRRPLARGLALLVMLLFVGGPQSPQAFELSASDQPATVEGGIGGTGVQPEDDGRGIGGTGVLADDGRGIGGTGIVGTITGFGSIFVNGYRIETPAGLPVSFKDQRLGPESLRLGQVVEVEAAGEGDRLVARSIAVRLEAGGPLQAIELAGSRVRLLGQVVEVPPGTVVEGAPGGLQGLRLGQHVEVSGLRREDGTIEASRIEATTRPEPARLRGTIAALDESGLIVDGQRVELPAGVRTAGLAVGRRVSVVGELRNGRLLARKLKVASARPFDGRVRRLSIEGYLRARQAGGLALGRLAIGNSPRALALRRAQRVVLTGRLDEQGVFLPEHRRNPRWLQKRLQRLQERGGQLPPKLRQRLKQRLKQMTPEERRRLQRLRKKQQGDFRKENGRDPQRPTRDPQALAVSAGWPEREVLIPRRQQWRRRN